MKGGKGVRFGQSRHATKVNNVPDKGQSAALQKKKQIEENSTAQPRRRAFETAVSLCAVKKLSRRIVVSLALERCIIASSGKVLGLLTISLSRRQWRDVPYDDGASVR